MESSEQTSNQVWGYRCRSIFIIRGNQQKVVVGNWLNNQPRLMMFDEPSRGIDVNAKQQIFKIMWELSRQGISSIVVSSELEELLEVCHRIIVMRYGKSRMKLSRRNKYRRALFNMYGRE